MECLTDLLSSWGYYGIFLFLVLGCFGPPLPDEILLIAIGYLSFGGTFKFCWSLPVVITGSLSGIILDYLVGRFCLYSIRGVKMQSSRRLALKMRRARDLVQRFGPGLVLGSYFLPGLRHWVPVGAGLLQAPPGPFGLGAGLGAILWSTTYLVLGYLLAVNGVTLSASPGPSPYLAIPGAALILLAVWLTRRKLAGEQSAEISTRI
jgi:membrane protein DedA with SNARE-associated domain